MVKLFEVDDVCWIVAKNLEDARKEAVVEVDDFIEDEMSIVELPENKWDELFFYDSDGPDEINEKSKRSFREEAKGHDNDKPYLIAWNMVNI